MNKRADGYPYNIILIVLMSLFILDLLVYYPSVGDPFDFKNIPPIINVLRSGKIDLNSNIPGFDTLNAILGIITSIPIEQLHTLPLQIIPLFLLFAIILKNISKTLENFIIGLLFLALFISKFGGLQNFNWWCHGVGLILALVVMFAAIMRLHNDKNQTAISLILIITLVSLNSISYKLIFFSLILLISSQILFLCVEMKHKNVDKIGFKSIFLFGIIYVLAFNKIFYESFIPKIRFMNDSMGLTIDRLLTFLPFSITSKNPLQPYYYSSPQVIKYLGLLWVLIMFFGLILSFVVFSKRTSARTKLSLEEGASLSLIVSCLCIVILYISLGILDVAFLSISCVAGYTIAYGYFRGKIRYLFMSLIIILFLINISLIVENCKIDFYSGYRYPDASQYLTIPCGWYIGHIGTNYYSASDIYSAGYFEKEIVERNASVLYIPYEFSRKDLLFLFGQSLERRHNSAYIFNNNLNRFIGNDWDIFKSWKVNREGLYKNSKLQIIYSSGNTDIGISI